MLHGSRLILFGCLAGYVSSKCSTSCNHRTRDSLEIDNSGFFNAYYRDSRRSKLGVKDETVRYVLFYNHGNNQNGDDYFCVAQQTARQYFCQDDTEDCGFMNVAYVIGMQFDGIESRKHDNEICFDSSSDPWNEGDQSSKECTSQTFSSYTILDNIFETFLDKKKFPNLQKIIAAGHSGGAQTMSRYALGSDIDHKFENIGVEFQFVIANPSSQAYFDTLRPIIANDHKCDNSTIPNKTFEFYDANTSNNGCSKFDTWKYGLESLSDYEYMSRRPQNQLINDFGHKRLLFVAGLADNCCSCTGTSSQNCCSCKSSSLDGSCQAELQGRCRLQRAHAYYQYLGLYFGGVGEKRRRIIDVPLVSHSACVIQDEHVKSVMFSIKEI